jgi:hypothetical protein
MTGLTTIVISVVASYAALTWGLLLSYARVGWEA